jgi:putative phosphoribosyl transferase
MTPNEVSIPLQAVTLTGEICLPPDAVGLALFAHGSGSSRHSPRNQSVARTLREGQVGTLLFDLLTAEEETAEAYTRQLRFDIPFLARRLVGATRWAVDQMGVRGLNVGYFGSSTGAGAALLAAAELGDTIRAVVSRGGRPDLAGHRDLAKVQSPTLLLVGGDDTEVLELNRSACEHLSCDKELSVIAGATHLFEEAGSLEEVARRAAAWFRHYLRGL